MGIFLILVGVIMYQQARLNKQNLTIGSLTNNVRAYEDLKSNNRTLQLTVSDLRHSKDSVVQRLDSVRNELKTARNDLKRASAVVTTIRETVEIPIVRDSIIYRDLGDCDFIVNKLVNAETSVAVKRIDDLVTVDLSINNTQYLYVFTSKEWRNYRRNWFDRLFHWDWKKDAISRYDIVNSNPIIEVTDTRVIEIIE